MGNLWKGRCLEADGANGVHMNTHIAEDIEEDWLFRYVDGKGLGREKQGVTTHLISKGMHSVKRAGLGTCQANGIPPSLLKCFLENSEETGA